jgi:hypothetical protein
MATFQSVAGPAPRPIHWQAISGRILSGLVVLFLLFDGGMKLVPLRVVIDTTGQLGWPSDPVTLRLLGVVLVASSLLYVARPTSLLGAILITGYLGGAVATHARIGSPLFTHTLFGVYLGVMTWAGLWLRDTRLRALLPLNQSELR